MLELHDIHTTLAGKSVLTAVNLTIAAGETRALIGSSGAGKTTLLRITLGLLAADSGAILIDNIAQNQCDPTEWASHIGYVPQDGGLFPHLDARANATLMAKLLGWDATRINRRLAELSNLVGLDEATLKRFPHALSGGQIQRVALIRAAFLDPQVMLLDEPMSGLDPIIRRELQQELKSIFKQLRKTVIIVTHDLVEAVFLADKISLLHAGRIIQTGDYPELLLRPADEFVSQFISAHRTLPAIEGAE